jgi:pyridoxal phosphate enzyme (YggS family)
MGGRRRFIAWPAEGDTPVMADRAAEIAANVCTVRARIAAAAGRAGRDPGDITLIAVTKTHDAQTVALAHNAGVRHFGENRVQEARPKISSLRGRGADATWHLIGHLQTNKVKAALECFDILHAVDSERLARAISRRAMRPVRVLIEVNVAGEPTKHGVRPDDAAALAETVGGLPNIDLRGLMTVAPQVDDPEDVRPVFRRLRELRDALGLQELSMGMTDDFEVAIEEGSTMVRVGRAIFGARREAT